MYGLHPVVLVVLTTTPQQLTTATPHNAVHLFDKKRKRASAADVRRLERHHSPREALDAFRSLVVSYSSSSTVRLPLSAAFASCATLRATRSGREIHTFMLRRGVRCAAAESSLVGFYAKCGRFLNAREVFDRMLDKDVVACTVMLMAYSDKADCVGAMALLAEMLFDGVVPNQHTLTAVLRGAKLRHGEQLHAHVLKCGWHSDSFVGSSLVGMYARYGKIDAAHLSFDHIIHKDLVCYNSLMSAYSRAGTAGALARLFVGLLCAGFEPSQSTAVALLNGCANAGFIGPSMQFHAQVLVRGFDPDKLVQGVIVDMYAKCGDLKAARSAFDRIGNTKNVVIWNSIIGGYGKHGLAREALQMFRLMEDVGVTPDHITFICVLSACSHAGLIEEGWRMFDTMCKVYGIPASGEHYCCMVDLLGRAGMVREAYEFIVRSNCELWPSVWGALLSACRAHGNAAIGEIAARKLFKLEPDSSGSYVALASIHAASGRWIDSDTTREQMDDQGVQKEAGYSWIEIDGAVRKFRAAEPLLDEHEVQEMHLMCDRLNSSMTECCDDEYLDLLVFVQDYSV